jgi:PadR family transcriptional regulator, regulatory protein PadR
MKFNQLGAFEELVLLAIGVLDDNAYGVTVREEISQRTGRSTSIGALHSALSRLEEKGFIASQEGGATAERGGRRKRFYRLTGSGKAALMRGHELRKGMLDDIPGLSFE